MKKLLLASALVLFSTAYAANSSGFVQVRDTGGDKSETDVPGTRDITELNRFQIKPDPNPSETRRLQRLHEDREERLKLQSRAKRNPDADAPVDAEDHMIPRESNKQAE